MNSIRYNHQGLKGQHQMMTNIQWQALLIAEQPMSQTVGLIILVVSCIQSLALNFEAANINIISDSTRSDTDISGALNVILTRKEFGVLEYSPTDILILVLATGYILLFTALNGIIFYKAFKNLHVNIVLSKIWKGWGYVHLFMMSLPFHNLAVDFTYSSLHLSERSVGRVIGSLMAIFFAGINIGLSIIQLVFSFVIKTKDPFSRTNNIYLFSFFILKIVQSTLNCLALRSQNQEAWVVVVTIIAFLFSMIHQAVVAATLPFYNLLISKITCHTAGLNIVISLIAIIFLIANSISEGSAKLNVLLFGFLLFGGIAIKLNHAFFISKLTRFAPKRLSAGLTSFQTYWAIQRGEYLRTILSKTLVPDTSATEFQLNGLLQAGYMKMILGDLVPDYFFLADLPNWKERREYAYQLYHLILSQDTKNHLIKLDLASRLIKDSTTIYRPSTLIQQVLSDKDAPILNFQQHTYNREFRIS